MSGLTLKIMPETRVLRVSVSGDFSLEEAKRTFLEVIDAIRENRSEEVFVDGREVMGNPSVIERFYYGEFVADALVRLTNGTEYDGDPRFAYVLHKPIADPERLGETVAVNRGVNIKVFENVPEAVEWLGISLE